MPSDTVASMIRPLTSSNGHTERAVKMKKRGVSRVPFPDLHRAAKSAMTAT